MIFAKKVHINLQMWIFFCTFASQFEINAERWFAGAFRFR